MPWALSVPLLPEESLSSWLVRAAMRQGCDPLSLTGAIWPSWRVWTRDIDREIPLTKIRPLVNASGNAPDRFKKAGVRDDCEKVAGYSLPEAQAWPCCWPSVAEIDYAMEDSRYARYAWQRTPPLTCADTGDSPGILDAAFMECN